MCVAAPAAGGGRCFSHPLAQRRGGYGGDRRGDDDADRRQTRLRMDEEGDDDGPRFRRPPPGPDRWERGVDMTAASEPKPDEPERYRPPPVRF
jgi:hypothetical protein